MAACANAEAWIRQRHQNPRGEPDGKYAWADVAACLEYHGHDLRHASDKVAVCRQAALRFRRLLKIEDPTEAEANVAERIERKLAAATRSSLRLESRVWEAFKRALDRDEHPEPWVLDALDQAFASADLLPRSRAARKRVGSKKATGAPRRRRSAR